MLQDIRYALRVLAKSPGFVAIAVLVLGLGIAGSAVTFGGINAYLLRPLPAVKDVDRVVMVNSQRRGNWTGTSYPDFLDWEQENRVFAALTANIYTSPIVTGGDEPRRLRCAQVSPGFFRVFPVTPVLGRGFMAGEYTLGAAPVVLISHGLWQRQFGGKPDVVAQSLALNGVSYRIVGVLPQGFRFDYNDLDLWTPLTPDMAKMPRGRRLLDAYGRLRPGVSIAQAQAEMDTIARRLEAAYPATNQGMRAVVRDLVRAMGQGPRESIQIMAGMVTFVLLIACANIANLQLARATGRTAEVAIRTAMGASRLRIARQVLIESLLISLGGGALGLGLGAAGAKALQVSIPANFQPANPNWFDGTVFALTAATALLAGLLSGLAPAFQVSRVNVHDALKEGGRSAGETGSRARLRSIFVVAEVALATMLLLASGLLVQSFTRLQQANPGFRADRLLTAHTWLPETKYRRPEQRSNFFHDAVERVSALPGVQSAAGSNNIPMSGSGDFTNFVVDGRPTPAAGHEWIGRIRSITPGYFQTLGIPLLRGRYFTEQDNAEALPVAIINERMAKQFFADEDPIGKRLKWSRDPQAPAPWKTIVGVAGNVKPWGLVGQPVLEMFAPYRQHSMPYMFLVMRTSGSDPGSLAAAVRAELRALDRDQPVTAIRSMENIIDESMTVQKYMTILTTIFAGIALFMAALGIYGVMSYAVSRRTHEFGVRMALGAGAKNVAGLVLRRALWLIGLGIVLGIPAALGTTSLLRAYLVGVGARDPATFVMMPALLALVAVAASYLPARRATRVEPMIALRYE